ncbi:hypothetical protein HKX48_002096 [Thoreauomyces humboldtii]|nr:hypothetical protein HKX48_002096 [Thoreauomyces humboldtii]
MDWFGKPRDPPDEKIGTTTLDDRHAMVASVMTFWCEVVALDVVERSRDGGVEKSALVLSLGRNRKVDLRAPLDFLSELLELKVVDEEGDLLPVAAAIIHELYLLSVAGVYDTKDLLRELNPVLKNLMAEPLIDLLQLLPFTPLRSALSQSLLTYLCQYIPLQGTTATAVTNGSRRVPLPPPPTTSTTTTRSSSTSTSTSPSSTRPTCPTTLPHPYPKHLAPLLKACTSQPYDPRHWETTIGLVTLIVLHGATDVHVEEDREVLRRAVQGYATTVPRRDKRAVVAVKTLAGCIDVLWDV